MANYNGRLLKPQKILKNNNEKLSIKYQ